MSIKKKLMFQTALILLLVVATALVSFQRFNSVKEQWSTYRQEVTKRSELIIEMKAQLGYGGAIHNFKNLVIRGGDKYANKFNKNYDKFSKMVSEYKNLSSITSEELSALSDIKSVIDKYKNAVPLIEGKYDSKSVRELDKMVKISDGPAVKGFDELFHVYEKLIAQNTEALNTKIIHAIEIMIALFIVMIVLLFVINGIIAKSLVSRIESIKDVIRKMTNGDFTSSAETDAKDEVGMLQNELGQFVKEMDSSFRATFKQLSDTGDAIVPLVTQISDIKFAANAEADISNQISSASQQMNATITDIAHNVTESVDKTQNTLQIAQEGGKAIHEATEYSQSMSSTMSKLAGDVSNLKDGANKIGDVVKVINDLSDQTNLLALNAAIEAARAGDAGRGFAVVADEVRKLAERTQVATDEIESVISEIQNSVTSTVHEANNAVESVNTQLDLTQNANLSFSEILAEIKEIDMLISGISAAVEEQSATTAEIASNMETLSHGSGKMEKISEELMWASDEMIDSVNDINKTFSDYNTTCHAIPFIQAKIAHVLLLKDVLHCTISGKCDINMPDHHNCGFGKLYYGDLRDKYGNNRDFKDLEGPHKLVHEVARKLVDSMASNDPALIEQNINTFQEGVKDFVSRINVLIASESRK